MGAVRLSTAGTLVAGAAALALATAGCAKDPCDGVSGTCISGRVEGAVTGLDQLRVVLDGASAAQLSPSAPSAFSLPVRLAIVLPASVTSPAMLTVEGLAGGATVATSGPQSVSFQAGAHASYTFRLAAGAPADMAGGDMTGIVPGHVSVFPSTLTFPATPRGTPSAPQTLTVYNRTGQMVSTVLLDMSGAVLDLGMGMGMGMGDEFEPTTASPAGCTFIPGGIRIPANVDCEVQMVFTPARGGPRGGMGTLAFDNGDVVNLTLSGVGIPEWSPETAAPPNQAMMSNLVGVWAADGVAHIVGGIDNGGPAPLPLALTSQQPGVWNVDQPIAGASAYYSLGGFDPMHLWGGGNGSIYATQGMGAWSVSMMSPNDAGTPGTINGIWAAGPDDAYAVTSAAQLYHFNGTRWDLVLNAASSLYAVSGAGPGEYVVAGTMGYMGRHAAGDPPNSITPMTTGTVAPLHGVWEAGPMNIFAVGDAAGPSMPGVILHCDGMAKTCVSEVSPSNGNLRAVSGRKNPMNGMLDVWAVGALGNQVLHSTGDGKWTAVMVPNNEAMNAVYVTPGGEVYAVGFKGEVNHLY